MTYAPIALFCYRRLDVLKQTVEALQKNAESKDSMLIIFSDGYKNDEDKKNVEEVREYIHTIDGFKNIEIIEAPTNKGLANSIIDGVTKIVNEYGKIIVVEDDILTSPYFLKYMNTALDMYENDDEVACISGYTYPIKTDKQSFFLKEAECWGWATWKKGWDNFEPNGQKLLDEMITRNLKEDFDFYDSYPFTQMLKDQIDGKNNSWAIRWYASCYLKDKLCLYLGKPVSGNIGFGAEGSTHCKSATNMYDVEINLNDFILERIEPKEDVKFRKLFCEFFRKSETKVIGNFLIKKIKFRNKRTLILFGFIKINYEKKKKNR